MGIRRAIRFSTLNETTYIVTALRIYTYTVILKNIIYFFQCIKDLDRNYGARISVVGRFFRVYTPRNLALYNILIEKKKKEIFLTTGYLYIFEGIFSMITETHPRSLK